MNSQTHGQPMKKTGLDDPDRVEKICDRGQRFLPSRPTNNTSNPGEPDADSERIVNELENASVECGLNPGKRFIPHDKLHQILTPQRVRNIIEGLHCFSRRSDKTNIAEEICHGFQNKPPCLKLLAALMVMDKTEDIAKHMDDHLTDLCFPLRYEGAEGNQCVSCKHHGKSHRINDTYRITHREDFSRWSYRLSAPFIKWREKTHSHYILDSSDVLPIVASDGSRSGGFSEIHKVKLHTSHFDFGGNGVSHLSSVQS